MEINSITSFLDSGFLPQGGKNQWIKKEAAPNEIDFQFLFTTVKAAIKTKNVKREDLINLKSALLKIGPEAEDVCGLVEKSLKKMKKKSDVNKSNAISEITRSTNEKAFIEGLQKNIEFISIEENEKDLQFLLKHAAEARYFKAIALLLDLGASLDRLDENSRPPVDIGDYKESDQAALLDAIDGYARRIAPKSIDTSWYSAQFRAFKSALISPSKDGRALDEILSAVSKDLDWAKQHPNIAISFLCQAARQLHPSSQVIGYLNKLQGVITGDRGAKILHEAIATGRVDIVRHLIALNVDASNSYPKPLVSITPVVQAIWADRLEIADLLINKGCELSEHQQKAILDDLSLSTDPRKVKWVLRRFGDQASKEKRFELMVSEKRVGEIIYWIEQGIAPKNPLKLARIAIEGTEHGYLLQLLLDKNLLPSVPAELLVSIVSSFDEAWTLWFMQEMRSKGVKIHHQAVLKAAAGKGQIAVAALLVSLGADCMGLPNETAIKHWASCLETSVAEQSFRCHLSEKNLAHLVGDSFIKTMRTDANEKLEGQHLSHSIGFLLAGLRYAAEKKSLNLDMQIKQLEEAQRFLMRLRAGCRAPSNEEVAEALVDLEHDLLLKIETLADGKQLLLPIVGWPVHAISVLVTRRDADVLELKVLNTGEGINFHEGGHDGARQVGNTINVYQISISRLRDSHLLRAILEPGNVPLETPQALTARSRYRRNRPPQVPKLYKDRQHAPEDFYAALAPFKVNEGDLSEAAFTGWKKTQLGGTCSLRCLLLNLRIGLAKNPYQQIIDILKNDSVSFAVEQYAPLLEKRPNLRRFLSIATPHLFDTFGKRLKQKGHASEEDFLHLERLKDITTNLEDNTPPIVSNRSVLALDTTVEVKSQSIRDCLSLLAKKEKRFEVRQIDPPFIPTDDDASPYSFPSFHALKDANDLNRILKDSLSFSRQLKNKGLDHTIYLSTILRTVGRGFLSGKGDLADFSKLVVELKRNRVLAKEIFRSVANLFSALYDGAIEDGNVEPSRVLALHYGLAAAYKVATFMEQADSTHQGPYLSYYGIHYRYFGDAEPGGEWMRHAPLNAQCDLDYKILRRSRWHEGLGKVDPLFKFENHKIQKDDNVYLSICEHQYLRTKKQPEYDYSVQYAKTLGENFDWTTANKERQEHLSWAYANYPRKRVELDSVEWRAQWLYAEGGLPGHFLTLRRLAARVSMCSFKRPVSPLDSCIYLPSGGLTLQECVVDNYVVKMNFAYGKPQKVTRALVSPEMDGAFKLSTNDQNTVITEANTINFRELLPIRVGIREVNFCSLPHSLRGISPFQLIDYYGKHLDELEESRHQHYFEATLFAAGELATTLRKSPHILNEGHLFFETAIYNFENLIEKDREATEACRAHVFLTAQHIRFLSYCYLNDPSVEITKQRISRACEKVCEMILRPEYQSESFQYALHRTVLDSFQTYPVQNFNQARQLLLSLAAMKRHEVFGKEIPNLSSFALASARSTPIQQADVILNILKTGSSENVSACFNAIVHMYHLDLPKDTPWTISTYPLCSCKMKEGTLEVNCFTGEVKKNGQLIKGLPEQIKKSKQYRELFDQQHLDARQSQLSNGIPVFQAQDRHGEIEIVSQDGSSIDQIRRKIEGDWYYYVSDPQGYPPVPAFPGVETLSVWKSIDPSGNYLFTDLNTMQATIRLDQHGFYTLSSKPDQHFEWIDPAKIEGGRDLQKLDPQAFILSEVTDGSEQEVILQLPQIRDESCRPLEFTKKNLTGDNKERWVASRMPHLFLSDNQVLRTVRGYNHYLVLESSSGDREALFPIRSFAQLKENKYDPTTYLRIKLRDDQPVASNCAQNAYLAYLALTQATTPSEYQRAMDYLEAARKFERYSPEELRLLGSVFRSQIETKDRTGYAYACCLYTAWLVHENLGRNPNKYLSTDYSNEGLNQEPTLLAEAEIWGAYWSDNYTFKRKGKAKSFSIELLDVSRAYLERVNHLPLNMRIENRLSKWELRVWDSTICPLGSNNKVGTSPASLVSTPLLSLSFVSLHAVINQMKDLAIPNEFLTRPTYALQANFKILWDLALSDDFESKAYVSDLIRYTSHDTKKENIFLTAVLQAALYRERPDAENGWEANSIASSIVNLVNIIMNTANPLDAVENEKKLLEALQKFKAESVAFERYVGKSRQPLQTEVFPLPLAEAPYPKYEPVPLPGTMPQKQALPFSRPVVRRVNFDELLEKDFEISTKKNDERILPFEFETKDLWLKESVDRLNQDLVLGRKKNDENVVYKLKEGISLNQVLTNAQGIVQQQEELTVEVEKRGKEIVALANTLPSDSLESLKYETLLAAGRLSPLALSDCIGLFLIGDETAYRTGSKLENLADIRQLHQKIGEYMIYSQALQRCQVVCHVLEALKVDTKNQTILLQQLAEELSLVSSVSESDPTALMVFEYSLKLVLRDHQLAGIRSMMEVDPKNNLRLNSKLLQRIQGGGKSLVFGHILALLKADGYHLSIHVPPTAQYETALYDMAQRSKQLFGQRERTFSFDDDPLKFTPTYLANLSTMLHEAVVNREYVTVTKETLRAMRCKYLKSCFQIQELPPGKDRDALMGCNAKLKEILSLLRNRGVFTFDEAHLAFDPTKELNMPYGLTSAPDASESHLISHIVQYACTARDKEGEPLLDVKNSAQQTESQRTDMNAQIIQRLKQEWGWDDAIIEYISGKSENLPESVESLNKSARNQVVLARQMLVGKWLEQRLNTNIDEDHGLQEDVAPRVSIPFLANMKPAEGSGFSDARVIVTNTFIAYLVKGLTAEQTSFFLQDIKQMARHEKLIKGEACQAIEETETAKKFFRAYGLDLFKQRSDSADDIAILQKQIVNGRPEAVELLLDFVDKTEIKGVELYSNQVCSNGQNTVSMAQSIFGYSASMENPNMCPVGTEMCVEEGTNGQTIHLLMSQQTDVVPVGSKPDDLFTNLIDTHPNRENIRAIIDAGALFRGMDNEAVARLICQKLEASKSEVEGVLFYHPKTGRLCWMDGRNPSTHTVLSGSTPEAILRETKFGPAQRFTYYDQDHTTGSDILQAVQAQAVLTVKEDTQLHEVLQGGRRMRGLDNHQRITVALPQGALTKIRHTLGITDENYTLTIKDIVLFTHLQEALAQREHNLLYCLQKMEDQVQQLVLDRLYILPQDEETKLFAQTSYLFAKNVAEDLYEQYAHKRQSLPISTYLSNVMEQLIQPLIPYFETEELDNLRKRITGPVLNPTVLKSLEQEILVSPKQTTLAGANREGSQTVHREQDRQSVKANVQEDKNEHLHEIEAYRAAGSSVAQERAFDDKEKFEAAAFQGARSPVDVNIRAGQIWSINDVLNKEVDAPTLFDDCLMITSNAAQVWGGRTDLLGPWRKQSCPVLLVSDQTGNWKAILCSVRDTIQFQSWIDELSSSSLDTQKFRLVRANGKLLTKCPDDVEEYSKDPHFIKLMLQALLLAGEYNTLSDPSWLEPLQQLLAEQKDRDKWRDFLEHHVLIGLPPGYVNSKLYALLHTP